MSQLARSCYIPCPASGPDIDRTGARCALVEQAADLATMLVSASPAQARAFAVALHERSCEAGTDERMEFWLSVVEALPATVEPPLAR